MGNGIYTALDYDIDYLAHYQHKDAKWGHHIYGPAQNPKKYSKGLLTKGLDWADKTASKLEKYAAGKDSSEARGHEKEYAKEGVRKISKGDFEGGRTYLGLSKKFGQVAAGQEAYNKRTRVRRALAGAAAGAIRGGMNAAKKAYLAYDHIKTFIKNPNYRKFKLNQYKTSIKKKASDFATAVRGALGKVRDTVTSLPNKAHTAYNKYIGNPLRARKNRGQRTARDIISEQQAYAARNFGADDLDRQIRNGAASVRKKKK